MKRLFIALGSMLFCATFAGWSSADEAAVRQTLESYLLAFNNQDAAALEKMWAENATYTDVETGEKTEGRAAIVADIRESLALNPSIRLSGNIETVQLITSDVANAIGQVAVSVADGLPTTNRFSAILVKQSDQWQIRSMEETPLATSLAPITVMGQLDWLIGKWEEVGGESPVSSTVKASVGGAFLIRTFSAVLSAEEVAQSTQVIGFDPRSQQIVSWTFHSDGSFGNEAWTKEGSTWRISSVQTLVDGRLATGTYMLTPVSEDVISLQLVGHEIDGEPQPAAEEVSYQRLDAAPSDAQTSTAEPATR